MYFYPSICPVLLLISFDFVMNLFSTCISLELVYPYIVDSVYSTVKLSACLIYEYVSVSPVNLSIYKLKASLPCL